MVSGMMACAVMGTPALLPPPGVFDGSSAVEVEFVFDDLSDDSCLRLVPSILVFFYAMMPRVRFLDVETCWTPCPRPCPGPALQVPS